MSHCNKGVSLTGNDHFMLKLNSDKIISLTLPMGLPPIQGLGRKSTGSSILDFSAHLVCYCGLLLVGFDNGKNIPLSQTAAAEACNVGRVKPSLMGT